jgi:integrase
LVEKVEESYKTEQLSKLPQEEKETIRSAYPVDVDEEGHPLDQEEAALWLALDGKTTWQQWVKQREVLEAPSKSTIINWKSRLKALSTWTGSDYISDLTKRQALSYRDHLIAKGHTTSTIINTIGALSGFWNWGIEQEIIETNIWAGLKKRLPQEEKRAELPTGEVFRAATHKASTITAQRKDKDYQFLIQRYTGCRQGEAAGLRHCDIDLNNKTITFEEWEKVVNYDKIRGGKRSEKQVRRFKTGLKDERCLPMTNALFEAIKDMPIIEKSDDPIWPLRYKQTNDSWGSHWVSEYRNKYNLASHDLRRYVITKLNLAGVSPYIIYEITRQKMEGMSDVTIRYTRPTTEELRQIMTEALD